ncbi:MAG: hypothetical protein HY702_08550, partial [Gemmatimonadetes bacterium]|nr:hypothetical protein [Gemmatimonadota bacterium]
MKASCAAWILALAHASVTAPFAPLAAQDRHSARLAGLNANLAGILPDPLTDPWRNPARWTKAATVYGLFRAAEEKEDFLESGATFPVTRGGAIAGRLVTGPGEDVGARAYVGSTSVGFGSGKASSGVRFDIVNDPDRVEAWGYAAAAGFLITTTSLGRFEAWGEYQRPRGAVAGHDAFAVEVVLAGPEDSAAHERLEPVILGRAGRHRRAATRGPLRWY